MLMKSILKNQTGGIQKKKEKIKEAKQEMASL